MAKFEKGARVKVVRIVGPDPLGFVRMVLGCVGEIVGDPPIDWHVWHWTVKIDGCNLCFGEVLGPGELPFLESELELLTPPAEDAWAKEAVKKVTKPQPVLLQQET